MISNFKIQLIQFLSRWSRNIVLPFTACVACGALLGCGDDRYKTLSQTEAGVQSVSTEPIVTNISADSNYGMKPIVVNPTKKLPGENDSDPDELRILKVDLYYKFEWAKRVLAAKVIPEDLQAVVDDARTRSTTLPQSRAAFLIKDIVELLQAGLDANKLDAKEKAAAAALGVKKIESKPIERKVKPIAKHQLWSPGKRKLDAVQREVRIAAESNTYGVSMEKLTWDKFENASTKTGELAKLLNVAEDTSPLMPDHISHSSGLRPSSSRLPSTR